MTPSKYKYITNEATVMASSWSNRNKLNFTYFNPNGAYAKHKFMFSVLMDLVKAGKYKSGALLAHNADFRHESMSEMHSKKVIGSIELGVLLEGWARDTASLTEFLRGK